jgi:hypothetical protein
MDSGTAIDLAIIAMNHYIECDISYEDRGQMKEAIELLESDDFVFYVCRD